VDPVTLDEFADRHYSPTGQSARGSPPARRRVVSPRPCAGR
jgi:hypothetical protein